MPVDQLDDFCWLDQVQSDNRGEVGDKAFYLGWLKQRGFPVVPGFTVTDSVFRRFLTTMNWLEPLFADLPDSSLHLDVDDPQQLQAIAQRIRHTVQTTPLWEEWLVQIEAQARSLGSTVVILRPSVGLKTGLDPTLSSRVRGLLSTQTCPAERGAIAWALRQVWAELFRARSLFYWQRVGIQLHQIHLGVLVQPVWEAIASGDARLEGGDLHLRATWGLGTGLTTGEAIPDTYQIDWISGTIQTQHLGSKGYAYRPVIEGAAKTGVAAETVLLPHSYLQGYATATPARYALNDAQIEQLIRLFQRVAAELGPALELEWTFCHPPGAETDRLYLTQVNLQAPRATPNARPAPPTLPPAPTVLPSHTLTGVGAAPGQVFAPVWVMPEEWQGSIPAGVVVVTTSLTPQWATQLNAIAAIVTEQGGRTSHAAILARELGIPAVVGVTAATQRLENDTVVCVDGDRGAVYAITEAVLSGTAATRVGESDQTTHLTQPSSFSHHEALLFPTATQVMLNLGRSQNLEALAQLPVEGVGLLRSEHLLLEMLTARMAQQRLADRVVLTDYITHQMQPILAAFAPRPVFYRTLDLRTQEFRRTVDRGELLPKSNPLLGPHGTFSDRLQPDLLDAQLDALRQLQKAGYSNLRLLLPFVRTVEEFQFCRDRVLRAGLTQVPQFQIWMMAEVPSVLFLLPDFVQAGVQGISIGSNDLTQLLLAIDRDHAQMAEAYDESHPAVMRSLHYLITTAQQNGIPCSICGEAPVRHPEMVEVLVRWGISAISVGPSAVEKTRQAIVRAERSLLLEAARRVVEP